MHRTLPAVFLAVLLIGCKSAEPSAAAPPAKPPANGNLKTIPVDSPQLSRIRSEPTEQKSVPVGEVAAPGKVEANPNRMSHVVLPLAGRVSTVLVKIGDFVRQGQPLLSVESADADSAVSAFQQATASVTQAKSVAAKAQLDVDRQKDLFDHGAVPQKEVFNSQAILVQAQAAVEQAQAAMEQARRRVQILGIQTGAYGQRVTVNAPISGRVLEMSIVNGEFRNDLSAPVLTIADLSSVWVTTDVPETAIRLVKTGESVTIKLAAYPEETFRGRVAMIGDTVDPQSRTIKVRAELANPVGHLKPEMFGIISLAEQTEMRPTVPVGAVIATEGRSLVWREKERGVFERVAVTTGPMAAGRIAILSGLQPGDRVVVDGVMLLESN